jgi:hypothetical protein
MSDKKDESEIPRRAVLGAISSLALAGCVADAADEGNDDADPLIEDSARHGHKPPDSPTSQELEKSLPGLIKKLRELKLDLNVAETAVFSSIVNSAALHLDAIQALRPTASVSYLKPISAVATVRVRDTLINLPAVLGLNT